MKVNTSHNNQELKCKKGSKIVAIIAIVTVSMMVFSGCSNQDKLNTQPKPSIIPTLQPTLTPVVEDSTTIPNDKKDVTLEKEVYNKYYIDEDILGYVEPINMEIYQTIYDAVDRVASEVDLKSFNPTEDEIQRLMIVIGDRMNYELFYYKDSEYNSKTQTLTFTYFDTPEVIQEKKKELSDKVQYVLDNVIQKDATDLQNEFAIYQYIIQRTVYDVEGFKTGNTPVNMHAVLVDGLGICYSYANTMKYLLNLAGIEAHKVSNIGHAWNIVKIDGEYYHVDTTGLSPTNLDYFNFSDEGLTLLFETTKDKIFMGNQNYEKITTPDCKSDKFTYMRKVGAYVLEGSRLYYANAMDEFKLYVMNLDGSQSEKVSDISPYLILVHDGWFYYSDPKNNFSLYKMRLDGTEIKEVDTSIEVDKMWLEGDLLNYGSLLNGNVKQIDLSK